MSTAQSHNHLAERLTKALEKKAALRGRKKHPLMKMSGKSVFRLKQAMEKK